MNHTELQKLIAAGENLYAQSIIFRDSDAEPGSKACLRRCGSQSTPRVLSDWLTSEVSVSCPGDIGYSCLGPPDNVL